MFVSQLQKGIFVSDKHDYISGRLYPHPETGMYSLLLMMSNRESTATGTFEVLLDDGGVNRAETVLETYVVGPDEVVIIPISSARGVLIRATIRKKGNVIDAHTYSLADISGVTGGLKFSDMLADDPLYTPDAVM